MAYELFFSFILQFNFKTNIIILPPKYVDFIVRYDVLLPRISFCLFCCVLGKKTCLCHV